MRSARRPWWRKLAVATGYALPGYVINNIFIKLVLLLFDRTFYILHTSIFGHRWLKKTLELSALCLSIHYSTL